jgi:transposase
MKPKHRVHLTKEQREHLRRRINAGQGSARELTHARVLLKVDEASDGPAWSDEAVARALDVGASTVWRVRRRFVAEGLDGAVRRKPPDRVYVRTLDGEAEAQLVALSCSEPPKGRVRWSMRLLANRLVELHVVETVSDETVRRVLKKTRSSRG